MSEQETSCHTSVCMTLCWTAQIFEQLSQGGLKDFMEDLGFKGITRCQMQVSKSMNMKSQREILQRKLRGMYQENGMYSRVSMQLQSVNSGIMKQQILNCCSYGKHCGQLPVRLLFTTFALTNLYQPYFICVSV